MLVTLQIYTPVGMHNDVGAMPSFVVNSLALDCGAITTAVQAEMRVWWSVERIS